MRRHPTPPALSLLALAASSCLLAVGCGGGTTAGPAPTGTKATAAATTAATTRAVAPATATRTTATPRTGAAAAVAQLPTQAYTPQKRRFAAAPITHAQVTQLVKRGSIAIPVAVGGPGVVSAFGQAQLPDLRIVHVAEAAPRTMRAPGTTTLTLALTPVARQQLAAGRPILMYLAVSFSKGEVIQRIPVHLRP